MAAQDYHFPQLLFLYFDPSASHLQTAATIVTLLRRGQWTTYKQVLLGALGSPAD